MLAFLPQLLGWRWGQAAWHGQGDVMVATVALLPPGAGAAGQVVAGHCAHMTCCLCFLCTGIWVPEDALPLMSSWILPCTEVTPPVCSESTPFP